MHRGLVGHYGEAWYDNRDAGLDRGAMERIASARTELARDELQAAPEPQKPKRQPWWPARSRVIQAIVGEARAGSA